MNNARLIIECSDLAKASFMQLAKDSDIDPGVLLDRLLDAYRSRPISEESLASLALGSRARFVNFITAHGAEYGLK